MATQDLNKTKPSIQFKKGLESNINITATLNSAVRGEPHYTTNTNTLYTKGVSYNEPSTGRAPITYGSTHYTIQPYDYTVIMNTNGASLTLTLPGASSVPNMRVNIGMQGTTNALTLTVANNNSLGFGGASQLGLSAMNTSYRLHSTGSTVWIIL